MQMARLGLGRVFSLRGTPSLRDGLRVKSSHSLSSTRVALIPSSRTLQQVISPPPPQRCFPVPQPTPNCLPGRALGGLIAIGVLVNITRILMAIAVRRRRRAAHQQRGKPRTLFGSMSSATGWRTYTFVAIPRCRRGPRLDSTRCPCPSARCPICSSSSPPRRFLIPLRGANRLMVVMLRRGTYHRHLP